MLNSQERPKRRKVRLLENLCQVGDHNVEQCLHVGMYMYNNNIKNMIMKSMYLNPLYNTGRFFRCYILDDTLHFRGVGSIFCFYSGFDGQSY